MDKKKLLICVLFLIVSLQLTLVFVDDDPYWDESVYIGMGKFFGTNGASGLFEPFRPPLFPLLLVPIIRFENPLLAVRLLVLCAGICCLVLTFMIGKMMFSSSAGFLAALALALTPDFFTFSTVGTTDIIGLFALLLGIWYFLQKRDCVSLFVFSLATLLRFVYGIFLVVAFAIILGEWWMSAHRDNRIILFPLLSSCFVIVPYLAMNAVLYAGTSANFFEAAIKPFLLGFDTIAQTYQWVYGQPWYYYLAQSFVWWFTPLILLWAYESLKEKKINRGTQFFLLGILSVLLFLSTLTHKESRYLLMIMPFVLLSSLRGIELLFCKITKRYKAIVATVFTIIVLLNTAIVVVADYHHANWRMSDTDKLTEKLSAYFSGRSGIILSSTPHAALGSDNLVIPLYVSLEHANKIYMTQKYDYIVISEYDFPCQENDMECHRKVEEFIQKVRNENALELRIPSYEKTYEVFMKK